MAKRKNGDVFILKCDVKKYFESVNHRLLLKFIKRKVKNENIFLEVGKIVESFCSLHGSDKSIPLGNITSQIFANIYLNDFDHFVKKKLNARFYIRYNDDFILVNKNKKRLGFCLVEIKKFMAKLFLQIPDDKISIRKLKWGVDFLGSLTLPDCLLLRDKTKQKIFERMNKNNFQSYFALLKHCDSFGLKNKLTSILNDIVIT